MNHVVNNALKLIKANAPEILTAVGVGGVISTAVLTAKATLKAEKELDKWAKVGELTTKQKAKTVWKLYIPPVASGVVTIACIVASHKSGSRRTAAAVTAYSLTEKAFTEYKDKAAEVIGEAKERRMRDDIAQDRVTALPTANREILVIGQGNVLCHDVRSQRYFRSSHEELQRAANDINRQLTYERYVSLSEYYIAIGLPITKESVYTGWSLDRGLMELEISATIADNDEPCLSVDFNYVQPLHDEPIEPICLAGTE